MTETVIAHSPAILEAAAELNDTTDAKYLASVFLQVTQKASLMLTRDLEIVIGLDLPALVSVRHTAPKKGGAA